MAEIGLPSAAPDDPLELELLAEADETTFNVAGMRPPGWSVGDIRGEAIR